MQRARDRGSDDRMMTEALAFHRNIRAAFQRLAKEEPDRITMVDGTLSREAVLAVLQERILPRLPARPMPEKRS